MENMSGMATIGSNFVNVGRMLGGANDAKSIKNTSTEIAEQSGPVVQDALDTRVQTSMASDLQKLRSEIRHTEGSQNTSMQTALMVAGALISGPNGVVPHAMADNLHTAVSTPEGRKDLAEKTVEAAQTGSFLQNAQLSNMGVQVSTALTQEGVKPNNVPTALFMGGAIQHHQSE
jgi:hypothetical protein